MLMIGIINDESNLAETTLPDDSDELEIIDG